MPSTPTEALLDVNVLIAAVFAGHVAHALARPFVKGLAWLVATLTTQGGLLRFAARLLLILVLLASATFAQVNPPKGGFISRQKYYPRGVFLSKERIYTSLADADAIEYSSLGFAPVNDEIFVLTLPDGSTREYSKTLYAGRIPYPDLSSFQNIETASDLEAIRREIERVNAQLKPFPQAKKILAPYLSALQYELARIFHHRSKKLAKFPR